jgi:hypothetical protein
VLPELRRIIEFLNEQMELAKIGIRNRGQLNLSVRAIGTTSWREDVACMGITDKGLVPIRPPSSLSEALKSYSTIQLRTTTSAPYSVDGGAGNPR